MNHYIIIWNVFSHLCFFVHCFLIAKDVLINYLCCIMIQSEIIPSYFNPNHGFTFYGRRLKWSSPFCYAFGVLFSTILTAPSNSWFREMVARETFNQSRRSVPSAVEDSVTAIMRSDKLRHAWLSRYYSSWIVTVKRRWDMNKTDLGYLTNDSMVRFIPFAKPNTQ